jgi:hypothetical protein
VLSFDALVRDDAEQVRALSAKFPSMLCKTTPANDPYTNHYYYTSGSKHVGLIVEDTPVLRALAKECGIDEHIYWGANTDPVSGATLAKVVELITKEGYTWSPQCVPSAVDKPSFVYELVKEADDGKRVTPLEEDDDDAPEPATKKAKSDLVVATE